MAYELVETIEVGSGGAASIEFTSIPQTGVDLLCVVSPRSSYTTFSIDVLGVLPNGASANRSQIALFGSGSSAVTSSSSDIRGGFMPSNITTSNTFGSSQIYISNYASSAAKSVSIDAVGENNATEAYQNIGAGLWNDTTAISSLELQLNNGNFMQYSSASLYIIS